MDKRIKGGIDHCSIFNRNLATSTDIFFSLGFHGDGNCTELSEAVRNAFVPSCRFVMDNAYIECVQFPEALGEFYYFLRSEAAVHLMTNLTPDAEAFCEALKQAGYEGAEVDTTIRENASHGLVGGTAKFLLVPVSTDAVPDTHLAWEQSCTPELLYQPTRWQHDNGVKTIEEVTLVMDDPARADAMMDKLNELNTLAHSEDVTFPQGLRSIRVMDGVSFEAEFGVKANPERSMYSAFTFGTESLDAVRRHLEAGKLKWREQDDGIYVDVMQEVNLVMVFKELT